MENKELIQVKQLPVSKADIEDFSNKILDVLESGTQNPLDILLRFKAFERVFEKIKPKLTELSLIEASKYKEKVIEYDGAELSVSEAGVSYSYEDCGDSRWESLNQQLTSIKADIKKREDFLKNIVGHETVVNEDTAEIQTIFPPIKKSTTTIKVTIKQ